MSSNKRDTSQTAKPRGRPRGFEQTVALDAAMRVFWAQGYAGASIDVLCRAMNVPRASLYQVFGDKQALFLAAITHYGELRFASMMQPLLGEDELHSDLLTFFYGVVDFATRDEKTLGCLVASALSDAAGNDLVMRSRFASEVAKVEVALSARIATAQNMGQIAPQPSADDLGMMLAACARGLMVRARSGCPAAKLYPAAKAAVDLCCRH
ncbi:TetR/AcrR family transcriptional regulator [Profundibacter sp.]